MSTETTEQGIRTLPEQEKRARELERQAAELGEREQELSRRLAEAHVSGEGDVEALRTERREAVELRQDIEAALPRERSRDWRGARRGR